LGLKFGERFLRAGAASLTFALPAVAIRLNVTACVVAAGTSKASVRRRSDGTKHAEQKYKTSHNDGKSYPRSQGKNIPPYLTEGSLLQGCNIFS
jgi:hypothetical protein